MENSKEKQIDEMAEMLNIIEKAREAYANDVTDRTENEYIREALLDAGYARQSEWISVEERLPDINDLCLLCEENRITKYRWIVIGYYHTNYDEYVTHWMPLPELPKGE